VRIEGQAKADAVTHDHCDETVPCGSLIAENAG
jgi:hypothetical protein